VKNLSYETKVFVANDRSCRYFSVIIVAFMEIYVKKILKRTASMPASALVTAMALHIVDPCSSTISLHWITTVTKS